MTITEDSVRNVNAAILKLKSQYDSILSFFDVNSVAAFEDKVNQAHILDNELKVYRYIVNQLLNLAQKWCVDNNSPVFWRVMKETMNSCSTCNAGQSECNTDYYNQAFGTFDKVNQNCNTSCNFGQNCGSSCDSGCDISYDSYDGCYTGCDISYGSGQNCLDCQNIFTIATEQVEGCGEEHDVCHNGYNPSTVQDCGNCYTSCQGCEECQNINVDSDDTYCYQNQSNASEFNSDDNKQNVILVHNNNLTDLNAALVKLQPLKDDITKMQSLNKELKTLVEKNFKDIMYIQYNLQYLESIKSLTNNFGRG